MGFLDDIKRWITGEDVRDQANEALDRQQAITTAGFDNARTAENEGFAQSLRQLGLTAEQVQRIYDMALASETKGGEGAIAQARLQAGQQVQGAKDTNQQMLDFFKWMQDMQNQQNAAQLKSKQDTLAALDPRVRGLAAGTETFTPTAMYSTQLAEMNKAMNNAFAARGLGNSSEAITGLREGQTKLMATDQQQQYNNVMDLYKSLMSQPFSQVKPQGVDLQNPYANLTDVSGVMQKSGANLGSIYQNMATAAGTSGTNLSNLYSTHAANLGNYATGQGNAIGNIAAAYGSVPQAGIGTGITNVIGLAGDIAGIRSTWNNGNKKKTT